MMRAFSIYPWRIFFLLFYFFDVVKGKIIIYIGKLILEQKTEQVDGGAQMGVKMRKIL